MPKIASSQGNLAQSRTLKKDVRLRRKERARRNQAPEPLLYLLSQHLGLKPLQTQSEGIKMAEEQKALPFPVPVFFCCEPG